MQTSVLARAVFLTATTIVLSSLTVAETASSSEVVNETFCSVPAEGVLTTEQVPMGLDVEQCDLLGRKIDIGPTTLPIPDPDAGIVVTELQVNGNLEASIRTTDSGEIVYDSEQNMTADDGGFVDNADDATVDAAAGARKDGCDNSSYGMKTWKRTGPWKFYLGDGVAAGGGSLADVGNFAVRAGNSWQTENSPCSAQDRSNAPGVVNLGTDSREADIPATGCLSADNIDYANTMDSGDLRSGTLARTCYWFSEGEVSQTDMRFNTTDYDFTYNPTSDCTSAYDLQSLQTHEIGHVLGFSDVGSTTAKYLTMYGTGARCTTFKRTLGQGDIDALRRKY